MEPFRFANLSDLHFAHGTWNPSQFFSKRWLANIKYILYKKKTFQTDPLWKIPELLKSCNLDAVIITGDLTTTSLEKEFEKAQNFVNTLRNKGLPVFLLPGNHDVYTKGAEKKKTFYNYFPSSLKHNRVELIPLGKNWWWIAIDGAVATSVFFSHGYFSKEMEENVLSALKKIPPDDHAIMANHFPLFGTGNFRHDLKGKEQLQKILRKHPQVKLYLHGHDHIYSTIDRREEGYPLVHNPGSCTDAKEKSFSLLELRGHHEVTIEKVQWNGSQWEQQKNPLTHSLLKH